MGYRNYIVLSTGLRSRDCKYDLMSTDMISRLRFLGFKIEFSRIQVQDCGSPGLGDRGKASTDPKKCSLENAKKFVLVNYH